MHIASMAKKVIKYRRMSAQIIDRIYAIDVNIMFLF
jgi:hypothetical protein